MIRKTLAYFFLTLFLGSIVFGISAILMAGRPEWESIPLTAWTMIGIFTISLLVGLPLLIPILIFYTILHFAKPTPKLYYILSAALGPVLCSSWVYALSMFFHKESAHFSPYWLSYGIGSALAGMVVCYLDLKGYIQSVFKDPRKLY